MTSAPTVPSTGALTPFAHSSALSQRTNLDEAPVSSLEASLVPRSADPSSHALAVCTVLFASCLNTMDASSLALSLPYIAESLSVSNSIHWAGAAYCIGLTITTILLGRCADVFGRKYVLSFSLTTMTLAHIGSALFVRPVAFFLCRGLAGLSSAGIHTMTILIMADLVPIAERMRFQSYLGLSLAIGDCIGPLAVSWFLQGVGWTWFYITTAPVLLIIALVTVFTLPKTEVLITKTEFFKQMDYGGFVFVSGFLVCLVLPLMNAGHAWTWTEVRTVLLFSLSIGCLGLFFVTEKFWVLLPIVPLRLLKTPGVFKALSQSLIVGLVFQPMQLFLPLYFTVVKGIQSTHVALLALFWIIPLCICSLLSGRFASAYGYNLSILLGFLLWICGLLLLTIALFFNAHIVVEGVASTLCGCGIGFILQSSVMAVLSQALKLDRSVAVTTRNLFKSIGGTLGVSFSSLVYSFQVRSSLKSSATELSEETRAFISKNIHSRLTNESEVIPTLSELLTISTLYSSLLQFLFLLWTCVLFIGLATLWGRLHVMQMVSPDEHVEYAVALAQTRNELDPESLLTLNSEDRNPVVVGTRSASVLTPPAAQLPSVVCSGQDPTEVE